MIEPSFRIELRSALLLLLFGLILLPALNSFALDPIPNSPSLGEPPTVTAAPIGSRGDGIRSLDVTAGFSVNTSSREQVRDFYNAVFQSSENVLMNSTAVTGSCLSGTNSTLFQNAVLRRINWFRAMGGMPADVTFSTFEGAEDQDAALMMAANNEIQHTDIPSTWSCFTTSGTNAAANSDLALGICGADAITGYIWDYGPGNWQVGHRRWILYPQTQTMATGDVPTESPYSAANATWIEDANFGGPRPSGTSAFIAWPPPGYAPNPVVFPQWSLGLSNADFSIALVSMESNGVPLNVTQEPYVAGYGEDTLVWYPSNLDPVTTVAFPFNGMDTTYSITVSQVRTDVGTISISYNVTVFDPSVAGTDYVSSVITGPSQPSINQNNLYDCATVSDPALTGYQWLAGQSADGNLADDTQYGLANFTLTPAPNYSIITNSSNGTGSCFHLCHTSPEPQYMQLNEVLLPATNTALSFSSSLGYASTNEFARVQISTNGGTVWWNLFSEAGNNGAGDSSFTAHSYSLSNCVGRLTLVRFNYDYNALAGGAYFDESLNYVGWCLENIVVTNTGRLVNAMTNTTASTNFNFVPSTVGNYLLAAGGVLYDQFPMDLGPVKNVTAVNNPIPTIVILGLPRLSSPQIILPFTETQGSAGTFELLQSSALNGPWTTNTSAVLVTNIPGSSYQFNTAPGGNSVFFRIRTP